MVKSCIVIDHHARIARQRRKIEALTARIGNLMSERVTLEEELADMYRERNAAEGRPPHRASE